MQQLARASSENMKIPDPHLTWLKIRLLERFALEDRAIRPLIMMEAVGQAVAIALVGSFLLRGWSELGPILTTWTARLHAIISASLTT
jgi:hypothetical protein